jgi:hypothetical protein
MVVILHAHPQHIKTIPIQGAAWKGTIRRYAEEAGQVEALQRSVRLPMNEDPRL